MIERRKTRQVKIDDVQVGGEAPISIQSMAKMDTRDVAGTVAQIRGLEREGCQVVRVAVPDQASAEAIRKIKELVNIPVVADVHFNFKLALIAMASGADAVRLNPGNIYRRKEVEEVGRCSKEYGVPIRVGVNAGSLVVGHGSRAQKYKTQDTRCKTREAGPGTRDSLSKLMVQSALDYIKIFEDMDFYDIIVSLKSSDVLTTIEAYRWMAKRCDYPFHLGVTATGLPNSGIIKSAVGAGSLLAEGIGDTIRVSLTGDPLEEVRVAKEILSSLGLRRFGPEIISCPTCGRCEIDLIKIVRKVTRKLDQFPASSSQLPPTTDQPLAGPVKVAIMGCAVNGPGEAKDADIGIAGGRGSGIIFKKGRRIRRVKEKDLVGELLKEIRKL